jgi:uncharacterized coiled-coil protein SlyX
MKMMSEYFGVVINSKKTLLARIRELEQELAECKAQYDDCDKLVSAQRAEIKRLRGAIEYDIFYLE